jgi:hypothetical protein
VPRIELGLPYDMVHRHAFSTWTLLLRGQELSLHSCHVIPAKAGIQRFKTPWIPAFAGMTAYSMCSQYS